MSQSRDIEIDTALAANHLCDTYGATKLNAEILSGHIFDVAVECDHQEAVQINDNLNEIGGRNEIHKNRRQDSSRSSRLLYCRMIVSVMKCLKAVNTDG